MRRPRFTRNGQAAPAAPEGAPGGGPGGASDVEADGLRDEAQGQALALASRRLEAVTAEEVGATRTLIGRVRARYVRLGQGAAGLVLGRDVELRQGAGLVLAGTELNVERSASQWLIGGLVQAKQVFAVAVFAGRVEGQVRCLFDARGAFAFGAGAALMTGLLRLLTRRK